MPSSVNQKHFTESLRFPHYQLEYCPPSSPQVWDLSCEVHASSAWDQAQSQQSLYLGILCHIDEVQLMHNAYLHSQHP